MKKCLVLVLCVTAVVGLCSARPTQSVAAYVGRMFPPDWSSIPTLIEPLLETLYMSMVGTSLAFVTAILLSFPANREMSTLPIYMIARTALSVMRATPVLVLGIICVSALGFGPLAGVIGIWFHTSGVLGKYFSEALESSDRDVVDASKIDGCNKWQTYTKVMMPMQMNIIVSYLVYYYEANFRQATFLGIVGAGGIGLHLSTAIGLFKYSQVGMVVVMIIGTALMLDFTSRIIRRRFL